jgi:3-keto-disaccharide hydrolase
MPSRSMVQTDASRWRPIRVFCLAITVGLATCVVRGQDDLSDAFRCESLAGWTTVDGSPVTSGWEASGGEIRLNRSAGRGGHIITAAEFGNFDLSFEWKIAARGNSGLKYRVRKYGNQTLGLEYQICDDPADRPVTKKSSGALYDLYEPAAERVLKPAGEWNTARIVVRGDRIEHWLNGGLIVTATVDDDEWQRRIGASKFADEEKFGENRTGRIMLTDHGSDVAYRNFVFRPLTTAP